MAEQAGRELSNFAQAVRSHPRFDGKIETLSVDSLEEVLKGTFRILKVTDEVRQAQLALVMLNHNVLQSWAAYCHSEEMEETATLAQLISFLKATYDTVSTAYQALDELVALRFNTDEDLPLFNQKFDYLVTRAEFPAGQPSMALNHYRRTMPVDIKKELFAADITTVAQAKNRALVLWQTWRALKTSKVNETTDNGPVPMEIDRVDIRGNQQYRQNFGQRPTKTWGSNGNGFVFSAQAIEDSGPVVTKLFKEYYDNKLEGKFNVFDLVAGRYLLYGSKECTQPVESIYMGKQGRFVIKCPESKEYKYEDNEPLLVRTNPNDCVVIGNMYPTDTRITDSSVFELFTSKV
ncbi:hypothetical protein BX667DRAFT_523264 [Coemansia mojavensis]|nr:hypothetical protein BX667DRAFT_523264 [Coemansia mojavensis]